MIQQMIGAAISQSQMQQREQQFTQPHRPPAAYYTQSQPDAGPSFDCAKRRFDVVDQAICGDPELSRLDQEMAQAYITALQRGGNPQAVKAEQRLWLTNRGQCQSDRKCIRSAFMQRTTQLQEQAGSAQSSGFEQPSMGNGQDADLYKQRLSPIVPPQLPTLNGKAVINSASSIEDEKWFMLVALGLDPDILSREPERFATRFLPPQDRFNKTTAWHSSNEFQASDISDAFLKAYGVAFRKAAIRTPVQFVHVQEIGFKQYDRDRQGFPLTTREQINLRGAGEVHLELYGNLNFPGDFWPISEANARRLLNQSEKISRHFVTLATVIELKPNERQPGTLNANWTHAYLLDPTNQRVVYDFGDAPSEAPSLAPQISRSSPFVAWTNPPTDFRPRHLSQIDGAVALDDGLLLMRLIAAGNVTGFFDSQNYFFQRVGLAQSMFTPSTYNAIFFAGDNFRGNNEFDKARSMNRFEGLFPALKSMAPKAPFDVTLVSSTTLGEYNQSRGGFPIYASKDFGLKDFAQQVRLTLAPSFSWPDLFWTIPADKAEQALSGLAERRINVAAHLVIDSVDPSTGRIKMSLRSLGIYSPKTNERLFSIPFESDSAASDVSGGEMSFSEPAVLDDVFACAELLTATFQVPDDALQHCTSTIWRRDSVTYADTSAFAKLARSDARYPFFPRDGVHLTPETKMQLVRWAKAYTDAATRQGLLYRSNANERTPAGMTYEAVGRAERSGAGWSNLITDEHLRPAQIVRYGGLYRLPVILITPNLASAYTADVGSQYLNQDGDGGYVAVARLRPVRAAVKHDDAGKAVLALFLRPERVDVTSKADGSQVASRDLSAIPAFGSAVEEPSTKTPKPLDASTIDLLAARYVGARLSPEALAYIVGRRWKYENSENQAIDRFFQIGSRFLTAEQAVDEAPQFIKWAQIHGPSLPLAASIQGSFEAHQGDRTASLDSFPCLSRSFAELMSGVNKGVSRDDSMRTITGDCRASELRFSFEDPLKAIARITGDLQVPDIKALGGREDVVATAYLTFESLVGLDQKPAPDDLFEQSQAATSDSDHESAGSQNIIGLKTTLSKVVYRDAKTSAPVASKPQGWQTAKPSATISPPKPTTNTRSVDLPLVADSLPQSRSSSDLNLLGITIGMSFENAEKLIREHMEVGDILEGARLYDKQAKQGFVKPMTSGKLFVSLDGKELIALIDEPPAEPQTVLAAWRRVYTPDGIVLPGDIMAGLKQKYGEPIQFASDLSSSADWSTPSGVQCYSFYGATHTDQLAATWYKDGQPAPLKSTNPRGMNSVRLADALFDPLNSRNAQWKKCGPFVTASYLQTRGLMGPMDELDMTLTDFGRYADAYSASRRLLQTEHPQLSNEAHIKF